MDTALPVLRLFSAALAILREPSRPSIRRHHDSKPKPDMNQRLASLWPALPLDCENASWVVVVTLLLSSLVPVFSVAQSVQFLTPISNVHGTNVKGRYPVSMSMDSAGNIHVFGVSAVSRQMFPLPPVWYIKVNATATQFDEISLAGTPFDPSGSVDISDTITATVDAAGNYYL